MIAAGSLGYAIAAKKNSRKVAKTGRQVRDRDRDRDDDGDDGDQDDQDEEGDEDDDEDQDDIEIPRGEKYTFDPDGSGPLPAIEVSIYEDEMYNIKTKKLIGNIGSWEFLRASRKHRYFEKLPNSEGLGRARIYDPDGEGPLPAIPVTHDLNTGDVYNKKTGELVGSFKSKSSYAEWRKAYPNFEIDERFPEFGIPDRNSSGVENGVVQTEHRREASYYIIVDQGFDGRRIKVGLHPNSLSSAHVTYDLKTGEVMGSVVYDTFYKTRLIKKYAKKYPARRVHVLYRLQK